MTEERFIAENGDSHLKLIDSLTGKEYVCIITEDLLNLIKEIGRENMELKKQLKELEMTDKRFRLYTIEGNVFVEDPQQVIYYIGERSNIDWYNMNDIIDRLNELHDESINDFKAYHKLLEKYEKLKQKNDQLHDENQELKMDVEHYQSLYNRVFAHNQRIIEEKGWDD